MKNEESLYPCLGFNYNMTLEQKQEAFQIIYDLLDQQYKTSEDILNRLYTYFKEQEIKHIRRQNLSDDLDIHLLRGILMDLTINSIGQWTNYKLLYFLIYNKFPPEGMAVEEEKNSVQS